MKGDLSNKQDSTRNDKTAAPKQQPVKSVQGLTKADVMAWNENAQGFDEATGKMYFKSKNKAWFVQFTEL